VSEEWCYGGCTSLERIVLADGTIETIVGPRNDDYLNGGYAVNGDIFFTMSQSVYGKSERGYASSDLWYIPNGMTYEDRVQVTYTEDVNELFIDVSPDMKKVLVSDSYYGGFYYVLLDSCLSPLSDCEIEYLDGLDPSFRPVGFSPSNETLYGTYDPNSIVTRSMFMAVNTEERGTALASTSLLGSLEVINNIYAVNDWAPKYEAPVTVVKGSSTTTVPTLSNTGSAHTIAVLALSLVIVVTATSFATKRD
jgi:hypothetical protein